MLQAQNINCATAPGPDEIELCRTIPAAILLDNGKPLSFEQMIGLAPYCAYVVGNDTGPTHLMAAANTHGLALFNTQNTTATQTGIDQFYDIISVDDFAELHTTQILCAGDGGLFKGGVRFFFHHSRARQQVDLFFRGGAFVIRHINLAG